MDLFSEDKIAGYRENSSMGTQERDRNISTPPSGTDLYASLFSTSLPVIRHGKVNLGGSDLTGQLPGDSFKLHVDEESKDPLEDTDLIINDSFLPGNEDELLAGLNDDFDLTGLVSQLEDLDDDIFGIGGGLEIDSSAQDNLANSFSRLLASDGIGGSSTGHHGFVNGVGTVSGEHPFGEHPSRTLFVRNINSNVEEIELRSLFEQYGDIRTMYTACKHRGFVMISYYDIRAARNAMRALQGKPLRRRKLDIHFSIPKDNPSEKDINQGTLVVFNLDPSVSNDDLRVIFGAYGLVKEIRETPHKRHHKFIEFYDVRAADMALKALNRSEIAGKRIKLEHSRPGGARRSMMQSMVQDPDFDDVRALHTQAGSPMNSPPGSWASFGSPLDHHSMRNYIQTPPNRSPTGINQLPGLASILPSQSSSPGKISPIGKDSGKLSQLITNTTNTSQGMGFLDHFSAPKSSPSPSPSPGHVSPFSEPKPNGISTLSGPEFLWGSPTVRSEQQRIGLPYPARQGPFLGPNSHAGSAPPIMKMDSHFGFYPEPHEASSMSHSTYGATNIIRPHNDVSHVMNVGALGFGGSGLDSPSPVSRHGGPIYYGNGNFGSFGNDYYGMIERARSKKMEGGPLMDNKALYQLNLEKIRNGEDNRTTLMIKNIPNKYTSKMLLMAIDETHKGTFDFLYLPIDFKNKCNMGYAFINMISPLHIVPFYEAFNGKKWEKFNSEKVASLAYARIQGKSSLVSHFQNSSLMNEDKRCRPILFRSDGQDSTDLENSGNLNVFIRKPDGSYAGDDSLHSPKSDGDEMQ